jgi:hypothetical protein
MQVIWIQDVFMISSFMFVQSLSFVIFLNTLFLSYTSGWKCYSCLLVRMLGFVTVKLLKIIRHSQSLGSQPIATMQLPRLSGYRHLPLLQRAL